MSSSPTKSPATSSQPRRRRRSAMPKSKLSSSSDLLVYPHLALLDNVTMDIIIDNNDKFVITTKRAGDNAMSRQLHSFDDLRELKKRLLAIMQQGHVCQAECPWMYSFLNSYFPKKRTLTLSKTQKMAKRRDAVEMCLSNVLQFITNKSNHSCRIVTNALAQEFVGLLFGYDTKEYSVQLLTPVELRSTFNSFSSTSSLSESSDVEDVDAEAPCQVCKASLLQSEGEGEGNEPTALTPTGRRSTLCVYTMTLRCGHRFHDECIMPILNETRRCPTCDHLEIE
uniref:RING-type domain-containing protein n=1 Tax=Globisporangium ultimum (strain ATCC 200006 / CBS 805.95 / DAOM BR144) TaxID=431595 RepID=K3X4Y5_GLOUD